MKNKNETRKTHKLAHTSRDRNEKRRLAFEKRNIKKEKNLVRYGAEGGSALVMAKTTDFNRRFAAAFLALVFAISTMVLGLNFATKAEDEGTDNHLVLNKYLTPNDKGNYDITLEAYANGTSSDYEIVEKLPTDFVVIVDQSGSMARDDMPSDYTAVSNAVNLETIATSSDRYYYKADDGNYYRVYAKKGYLYYKYASDKYYSDDFYGKGLFYYWSSETSTASGASGYYYYDSSDSQWYPVSMRVSGESITGGFQYKCYYTYNKNGTKTNLPFSSSKIYHSYRQLAWQRITIWSDTIQHDLYKRRMGYTMLCYQDADGAEHLVETTAGVSSTNFMNSSSSTSVPSSFPSSYYSVTSVNGTTRMLYNTSSSNIYKATGNNTRLDVLSNALNQFAQSVANERDTYGPVDNKIAIVGFSSANDGTNYNNTEVLTGNTIDTTQTGANYSNGSSGYYYFPYYGENYTPVSYSTSGTATNYNGPQYYSYTGYTSTGSSKGYSVQVDTSAYRNALVSATDGTVGTVNDNITKAIKSISAYGGTQPADGFEMAYQILNNRESTTYTYRSGTNVGTSVNRNTFVIFFTDGRPGNYGYSNQYSEANSVVAAAKKVKELGASVFSIGVFDESDGNPLTYRKSSTAYSSDSEDEIYDLDFVDTYQYSSSTYYYLYRMWLDGQQTNYGSEANDTIYDYMSVVSSNYPNATSFVPLDSSGQLNVSSTYISDCELLRGTYIGSNNYYRMAANQDTLVAAFESIVTNVSEETSTTTTTANDKAILQDVINTSDFTLDSSPSVTYGTVNGTVDINGTVTFYEDTYTPINDGTITHTISGATINVTGFDYAENCISYGTNNNSGKMLRVTISGVTPNSESYGSLLSSNVQSTSGIFESDSDGAPTGNALATFNLPQLVRYKYTMNVTDADGDATFDVAMVLASVSGETNDFTKVSVLNGSSRTALGQTGEYTWSDVANTNEITLEYITSNGDQGTANPSTCTLSAQVTPTNADASSYTYYLDTTAYVNLSPPDSSKALPRTVSLTTQQNGNLYVDSVANNHDVTFHLTLNEDSPYVDEDYVFTVGVTLSGVTADQIDGLNTTGPVTYTSNGDGTYSGTLSIVRGAGDTIDPVSIPVPSGATLAVTHSDYFYTNQYIALDNAGATPYAAQTISTDTDIYLYDIMNEDIGAGVLEDSNPLSLVLYVLAGTFAVAAAGAGVYEYRRKKENG